MVGASHVIWPDSRCCSAEVLDRARQTCRVLGIPYLQEDLVGEFRSRVVEDFIATYLQGKTPNPCVICNKHIRFDTFYKRLLASLRSGDLLGARERLLFATGHYARIVKTSGGTFLAKGIDSRKDQSYMLYQVDRQMLSNMVLPLGEYRKTEVVSLAERMGLPYTRVRESQDACFVKGSYVDFLCEQSGTTDLAQPGEIVDLRGRVLGRHRGTIHYTVGQRRGLGLADGPWYVAAIEPGTARVVVARQEEAGRREFRIDRSNWFMEAPLDPRACTVKIRYQIDEIPCTVQAADRGFRVLMEHSHIVSPGQSAVFYDRDLLIGGGIIL